MAAAVELRRQPLWRLRLRREAPRIALLAFACWGIAANLRFTLAPPAPRIYRQSAPQQLDRAAQAFAVRFARAYLTFNGADPSAFSEGLSASLGRGAEGQLGVTLPGAANQTVSAAEAVSEREGPEGIEVFTVVCQTDDQGTVYLAVPVFREPSGAYGIAGYPAFVGGPQVADWREPFEAFPPVEETGVRTVVERALRNYLAGDTVDLAADLAEGAVVTTPPQRLLLEGVQSLRWVPGRSSVVALVDASDRLGARYTLSYQLDLAEVGGRWEIKAIEVEPNQG